jgi:hypothetical protein
LSTCTFPPQLVSKRKVEAVVPMLVCKSEMAAELTMRR